MKASTRSAKRKADDSQESQKPARRNKKSTGARESNKSVAADVPSTEVDPAQVGESQQYWLMKAEPETRWEENSLGEKVNVAFSIDDLRAKTEPEPWDGIRNGQAQKNMKTMKKGDLAFFYESNCKTPGIVGVMEIVQEASPDPTQLDPHSIYYDPKMSQDKMRWMLVHVKFRELLKRKITLKEMQALAKDGGVLEGMGLLRQTRLSVSRVDKVHWDAILELAAGDAV